MEKRRFSRVAFDTLITLTSEDENVIAKGVVQNVSMAGLLMLTENTIEEGTRVSIDIFLDGATPSLEICLMGNVVRGGTGEIGIAFDLNDVPLDALSHLRQLVSYNLGDGDKVMDEYFAGIRRSKPSS